MESLAYYGLAQPKLHFPKKVMSKTKPPVIAAGGFKKNEMK